MPLDYSAESLVLRDGQVRLLKLLPGSNDTEISAELHVHDLDECPPYVAISYTWGDPTPTLAITVNGQRFQVRMNCWYALWQMRHHKHYKHFWIDSICIDQSNIAEKNVQVASMGKIYHNAALTACCLGPGRHLSAVQRLIGHSRLEVSSRAMKAERDSLKTLQQHPYFRRMWIKQELILSHRIRLFCGLDCIDWQTYEDILIAAGRYDIQHKRRRSELHQGSKHLTDQEHKAIIQERRQRHGPIASPEVGSASHPFAELWKLLARFGESECQDPHDKVYALMPLLSDELAKRLSLTIAYEKPLLSLCLDLVRGYVQECLDSSQPPHMFPVTTWFVMIDLIHEGFRLTLQDPGVAEFASSYRLTHGMKQPEGIRGLIGRLEYVPADVLHRFTIQGRIGEIPRDDGSDERDVGEDVEVVAFISETMPVREIFSYLAAVEEHIGAEEAIFRTFGQTPFTALPPQLDVKIVLRHEPGGDDIYDTYLVSPVVEVGDEVIICVLLGPTSAGAFAPVVRAYDQPHSRDSETARYSFLLGWALQLGHDGTLLKNVDVPVAEKGYGVYAGLWERYREADGDVDARPLGAFAAGEMVFNFYYEDLILHAILLSDAAELLTARRTHRDSPSFVAEFFVDELEGDENDR